MMAILIGGKVEKRSSSTRLLSMDSFIDLALQDPGSITLVWAFYKLARNPQIVEKLRKEIQHR